MRRCCHRRVCAMPILIATIDQARNTHWTWHRFGPRLPQSIMITHVGVVVSRGQSLVGARTESYRNRASRAPLMIGAFAW